MGGVEVVDDGVEGFSAFLPELGLQVVPDEHVIDPVGAVLGEPTIAIEILELREAVAEILTAAVHAADGVEQIAGGGIFFSIVLQVIGLCVGVAHLVGELEFEADEIDAAGA